MKYIISIITLLMLIVPEIRGQDVLNDYLKQAAEKNPALQAKFKKYMAAMEKVPQVNTLPDPQIAFGYFVSPVETRVGAQQAKVSLKQRFPWFGTLNAQEDHKTKLAQVKFREFEAMKVDLFYNVKKVWYDIYVLEKEIDFVEKQIEFYKSFQSIANTKVEAGKAKISDVIRINIRLDYLNNRLEDLQDKRAPLRVEFNKLLNRDENEEVEIADSIDEASLPQERETIIDSVIAANSELNVIRAQERAGESAIDLAKLKGYPGIGVALDYAFVNERTDMQVNDNGKNIFMPMLSFNVPIYRRKYNSMVKEEQLKLDAVQEMYGDKMNNLEKSFEDAIFAYENAQKDIRLYNRLINQAQDAQSVLITSYSTAGSEFNQIVDFQEEILKYELKLEKARAKLNVSIAAIDKLIASGI